MRQRGEIGIHQKWLWPPITSIIAGPPPLNGTITVSMPAIIENSTEAV